MEGGEPMMKYTPTKFMVEDSKYNKKAADYAVSFIECLSHTKGTWAGKKFELLDWQEQIIRDLFGILKPNGYRQFNTAYIEVPKKNGKSELAAAVALLLTCGDGEERAEVYGCAADRQQAAIVFDVAADMVRMCPALNKRVKILTSQKRIVYIPTNSFYQVLSAEAYSKHGFNIHGVVFDELHTQYIPRQRIFWKAESTTLPSTLSFMVRSSPMTGLTQRSGKRRTQALTRPSAWTRLWQRVILPRKLLARKMPSDNYD